MSDNTHLILSRREDESLAIRVPDSNGTTTTVYVDIERLSRSRVKMGIEAPRGVSILRYELTEEWRGKNE